MLKKVTFTSDELRNYFTGELESIHAAQAREHEQHLRIHADGIYPKEMIEQRRPNEPDEVKTYRELIWKPKTKPFFTKILNSLSKIRRSTDWSISYPDEEFNRIPDGEKLEDYCEQKFPFFKSVTNWAFGTLLREYAVDPNAVLFVKPIGIPEDVTEVLKPFPIIFNSSNVIEHREENYSILYNPLGSVYYVNGVAKTGDSYYVVTTMQILRYDQVDDGGKFNLAEDYTHSLGLLPCYRLGGLLLKVVEDDFLYESRLAGVLSDFDEALREYSDLQASKVMHIYAERWEITNTECRPCNGTGKLPTLSPNATAVTCNECAGVGYKGSSPYSKLLLSLSGLQAATGTAVPIPPAGYVEKDSEIVKIQNDGVIQHIYDGLSSINMEHLAKVPLAESGISKEVDRDEANNFVHAVGEDIVRIMDWLYYVIAKYRYSVQYNDEEVLNMLPAIPVPEHFDIFSTKYIEEELKNAKDNKLNPVIVSAMELNYAAKKFYSEPDVRDRLTLTLSLDPLPNISEDDKQGRLSNKGIRQIDYIISSNINGFINRALIEDENFAAKEYKEQRKVLETYADEVIAETSAAQNVLNSLNSLNNGEADEKSTSEGGQSEGGNGETNPE